MDDDKIIEFKIKRDNTIIDGYMYLKDADSKEPLFFYDDTGNVSNKLPNNPHDKDTDFNRWESYEELLTNFSIDWMLIQFLIDYAYDEDIHVMRDGYELFINMADDGKGIPWDTINMIKMGGDVYE